MHHKQSSWHITSPSQLHKAIGILAVCFIIQAIPFSIAINIQPLFMPYVTDTYHLTRFEFSVIYALGALTAALCASTVSKLYLKVNVKLMMSIGIACSGLAFIGFSFARHIPLFYAMAILVQFGSCIFSSIGISFIIHHWFPQADSGKALGIAFGGGAVGNILLQPLTEFLLTKYGISFSYMLFGIMAIVVGIPLVVFFIRLPKASLNATTVQQPIKTGPDIKTTKKMPLFWLFSAGFVCLAIGSAALGKQYAEYLHDGLHITSTTIGIIGSCFAAASFFGTIGGGMLFDKIGTFKTMLLAGILTVTAIVSLLIAKDAHWVAFVFSIAFGLSVYSTLTGPAYMAGDVFGQKDYSQKLGAIKSASFLGFGLGSLLFGFLETKFSFTLSWYVVLVLVIVGYSFLLIGISGIKKKLNLKPVHQQAEIQASLL